MGQSVPYPSPRTLPASRITREGPEHGNLSANNGERNSSSSVPRWRRVARLILQHLLAIAFGDCGSMRLNAQIVQRTFQRFSRALRGRRWSGAIQSALRQFDGNAAASVVCRHRLCPSTSPAHGHRRQLCWTVLASDRLSKSGRTGASAVVSIRPSGLQLARNAASPTRLNGLSSTVSRQQRQFFGNVRQFPLFAPMITPEPAGRWQFPVAARR